MRFIISKGYGEKFEELKVFESSDLKATYQFLVANASKGRLSSYEALERDIEKESDLEPVYGFYLKDEGNELFYMQVNK